MADDTWVYWTIFAAYIVFLFVVGFRARKKTKTLEDFMVAGRSIGPLLLGLSFGVTYFSASLIIGAGPKTYNLGLGTIWIGVINGIVGIGLFMMLFGNRTRIISRELGCLTVPEMLAKRYEMKSLQTFSAIVILLFEIIYLVAVFMGLSILFSVILPDMENAYIYAAMICGIITIVYLMMGGSHGAIFTDVFESIIMLVGVLMIFFVGLSQVGGFEGVNLELQALGEGFTTFPGNGGFNLIGAILVSSIGIWGSPQMMSRYFTAKNRKSLKWGLVISLAWGLLIATLAYVNGGIGLALFGTDSGIVSESGSDLIPQLMLELLPSWLAALFIACVTAASLTTGEKIILVATSAVSRDIYQEKTGADDKKTMKVTRLMTIVIVVIAVIIAIFEPGQILDVTFFAFSSLASVTLVPYIYGLFWKRGTGKAALVSALVCFIINTVWFFAFSPASTGLTGLFGDLAFPLLPNVAATELFSLGSMTITIGSINEFIPAQIVASIVFPLVSLATERMNPEFVDKIFDKLEKQI